MNAEVAVMKNIILLLLLSLLLTAVCADAMDMAEGPVSCKQCGMNRTAFAHSRMLIAYADGSTVGLCSLHCAAAELHQTGGRQVRSLMVADYSTKKMIDAGTAVWVVGGEKKGVMTAQAKWAFARVADVQGFIKEHGGITNTFDQAMNAAKQEVKDQADADRAAEGEMLQELQ
jgi:nitrous oxide reductase accessory protein NosL